MRRVALLVGLAACARPEPPPPAGEPPAAIGPAVAGLLADIDRTADPCADFYRYACGGWHERHPGQARQLTVRTLSAEADLGALVAAAAADEPPPDPAHGAGWAFVGSWRRSCSAAPTTEVLAPIVAPLRGSADRSAAAAALGAMSAHQIDPVFATRLVQEGDAFRLVLVRPPKHVLLDRRIDPDVYGLWSALAEAPNGGDLVPIAGRGGFDWAAWAAAADLRGTEVFVDATWADSVERAFAAAPAEDVTALVALLGDAWLASLMPPPYREDECVAKLMGQVGPLLAPHYVAKHLTAADAAAGDAVVREMRDVLLGELLETKTFSPEVRELGRDTLSSLAIDIGPAPSLSFAGEPLDPSYRGHALTMSRAMRGYTFEAARAERGVGWMADPWVTNALYSPMEHRTFVTAAALSRPWYVDGSRVISVGALGSVVAHEMVHALTVREHRTGHADWMAAVGPAFDEYGACLAAEHEAWRTHLATEGLPPYDASAEEDVADAVGLHVAWTAWREGPDDRHAASYSPLTPDQVFFVAYGQAMCDAVLFTDGQHDVMRVRINAAVAQEPAFAKAFGCYPGQPQAPKRRCEPLFGDHK